MPKEVKTIKKHKVLIVEDDINFVSILKQKLEDEGFLVVFAQDGKEGISSAKKENPDLILSDVLLPITNGVEMVKKIRENSLKMPAVFLTNVKEAGYSEEISKLKGTVCLIKSDTALDKIVETIKKLL